MQARGKAPRRERALLTQFDMSHLHLKKPLVVAFWSFAFPGFGYLAQSRYLKGYIFVVWEFIVNTHAHINASIQYSMVGEFTKAKDILDMRWLLLYVGAYVYCIWDSYRSAVDGNKLFTLANREQAPIPVLALGVLNIHYLDKKIPWVAGLWNIFMPGIGHFYVSRILTGMYLFAWWIAVCYQSNVLPALDLTFTGHLGLATKIVNPEWLLYIPSIYCFAAYDAYSVCVEQNRLFEQEQMRFLQEEFQLGTGMIPRLFVK